jgi:hypothetical protein
MRAESDQKNISVHTDNAPTAFHFTHGEFPGIAIALAELECSDASTFCFAVVVNEK